MRTAPSRSDGHNSTRQSTFRCLLILLWVERTAMGRDHLEIGTPGNYGNSPAAAKPKSKKGCCNWKCCIIATILLTLFALEAILIFFLVPREPCIGMCQPTTAAALSADARGRPRCQPAQPTCNCVTHARAMLPHLHSMMRRVAFLYHPAVAAPVWAACVQASRAFRRVA